VALLAKFEGVPEAATAGIFFKVSVAEGIARRVLEDFRDQGCNMRAGGGWSTAGDWK